MLSGAMKPTARRLSPRVVLPCRPVPPALFPSRTFSTSRPALDTPPKADIKLISQIRSKRPGTPLSLARSALQATSNDLAGALQWIADQAVSSGTAKAAKLSGRAATEGLVGIAVLADGARGTGVRAALVELSCETDFVARTDEFGELLEGITRSVAFFAEPSSSSTTHFVALAADSLAEVPILPLPSTEAEPSPLSTTTLPTVSSSIAALISRLGENISLKRAVSIHIEPSLPRTHPAHLIGSYIHGAKPTKDTSFQSGTLASLLLLKLPPGGKASPNDAKPIARALARQVVAVPTTSVRGGGAGEIDEQSPVLYQQPLITLPSTEALTFEAGSSVETVLGIWSKNQGLAEGQAFEVLELKRWEVGAEESS